MMIVMTCAANGRPKPVDLHKLTLPNGTPAWRIPRDGLYRELSALGIPEIDADMGVHDLLLRLAWHEGNGVQTNGKALDDAP